MTTEIKRSYRPCATAGELRDVLDEIADGNVQYIRIGNRDLVEVQIVRSRLTDGSEVQDVLLIAGPAPGATD